jgi:hypothetical protein
MYSPKIKNVHLVARLFTLVGLSFLGRPGGSFGKSSDTA